MFSFFRTILVTSPVNFTVVELIASDDDLEGDLNVELIGTYPGTEYFDIEKSGPPIGNQQSVRLFVKRPLTEDLLKSNLYLVRCCQYFTVLWD